MKKKILILCCVLFAFIESMMVYADESTYIYYDYETGEENEIVINDNALLVRTGYASYTSESSCIAAQPYNVSNDVEELDTLKELTSSTLRNSKTILYGESIKKVSSLKDPFKKIVCLQLGRYDKNGKLQFAGGTGFMVGPNIMLTAGHCMYGLEGGNVDEMRVYYNQHSSTLNTEYCYPAGWIIPSEYKQTGSSNYDWCIVFLQKHIGNTYGWFGYDVATENKSSVSVSGYPDMSGYTYYQYRDVGSLTLRSSYRFYHTCSTLGGESGAPVFDSNYIVWGIHTNGAASIYSSNSGTLITQRIYNLIEYYK